MILQCNVGLPIVEQYSQDKARKLGKTMFIKFIMLLILLAGAAGLVYVAITDVTIKQTETVVKIDPQTAPADSATIETAD